ncbi:MAG: YcxB family protein [Pseudomonadota bacterium]
MTWFLHQTPLGRDSATPGPVRGDACQGGAAQASTHTGQLHFTVRYGLSEYVSFMWQHAAYLIRRRRIGRLAGGWMLTKSTASSTLHFILQGRSRTLYDFTIDVHGVVRASGTGVTLVPWADVRAIRRYSRGYLMVLKRGTLPIPLRCLDGAQAIAMDAFAATVKAARR